MCGIAAIVRFDGKPVRSDILCTVISQLEHRGRDDTGVIFGSGGPLSKAYSVALGHRRLSVIDLSTEASQPMAYANDSLWITLNGEIYNYIELRDELRHSGYQFKTQSDTEVALAAYDKWGDDCVTHFNGMFAFALWDEQRGRLICARDHFGIKPFYYMATAQYFVCSSESRSLRQFHSNTINPDGLAAYLLGMYVPGDWSIFQGVKKLLPGHVMTIYPDGRIHSKRYWKMWQFAHREDTPRARRDLEDRLKLAVARQLRSDVPIGALLSGGIDSGMVVALAARQVANLRTYSVGFEGLSVNELPMAAEIATLCGTSHREAWITAEQSIELLDSGLCHLSEPIADSAIVPSFLLARMAQADGIKVLLSGTGGDEVFAGYERYLASTARRRLLMATPESLRRLVGLMLPASSKTGARLRNTSFDLLLNTGGDFGLCTALLGNGRTMGNFLSRLLTQFPSTDTTSVPRLYQNMAFDINIYLPDEILLLFDQISMTHTIEGRVPLLDIDVVKAAWHFPPSSHASNSETKLLFRDLASSYLGIDYVRRTKQGFGGPVAWWVEKNPSVFRDVAMATTSIPGMEAVSPQVLKFCGHKKVLGRRESNALFILYCLGRWYDSIE